MRKSQDQLFNRPSMCAMGPHCISKLIGAVGVSRRSNQIRIPNRGKFKFAQSWRTPKGAANAGTVVFKAAAELRVYRSDWRSPPNQPPFPSGHWFEPRCRATFAKYPHRPIPDAKSYRSCRARLRTLSTAYLRQEWIEAGARWLSSSDLCRCHTPADWLIHPRLRRELRHWDPPGSLRVPTPRYRASRRRQDPQQWSNAPGD